MDKGIRVAEDTQGGQWIKESTILGTQNDKANRNRKISENIPPQAYVFEHVDLMCTNESRTMEIITDMSVELSRGTRDVLLLEEFECEKD